MFLWLDFWFGRSGMVEKIDFIGLVMICGVVDDVGEYLRINVEFFFE